MPTPAQELCAAVVQDDLEAFGDCLRQNPDLELDQIQRGDEPLLLWIMHQRPEGAVAMIRALKVAGADPNAQDNENRATPLHVLTNGWEREEENYRQGSKEEREIWQALWVYGADLEAQDAQGDQPVRLHLHPVLQHPPMTSNARYLEEQDRFDSEAEADAAGLLDPGMNEGM